MAELIPRRVRFGNPARVAIYGGCYGGCAALAGAAFTPEQIVAALAGAGIDHE